MDIGVNFDKDYRDLSLDKWTMIFRGRLLLIPHYPYMAHLLNSPWRGSKYIPAPTKKHEGKPSAAVASLKGGSSIRARVDGMRRHWHQRIAWRSPLPANKVFDSPSKWSSHNVYSPIPDDEVNRVTTWNWSLTTCHMAYLSAGSGASLPALPLNDSITYCDDGLHAFFMSFCTTRGEDRKILNRMIWHLEGGSSFKLLKYHCSFWIICRYLQFIA